MMEYVRTVRNETGTWLLSGIVLALRQGTGAMIALVLFATSVCVACGAGPAGDSAGLGCDTTMVIAAAGCKTGAATALDDNQPIDDAPWCTGYDTTFYGCFDDADMTSQTSVATGRSSIRR
jgi:hypothetical protein